MKIEWSHVTKIYEPQLGLEPYPRQTPEKRYFGLLDFSATARQGITAILGSEGAGKSTLLRLTATLIMPDDGRITYRTKERRPFVWSRGSAVTAGTSSLGDVKNRITYVPHTRKLDHDMTVEEALLYQAQLRRVPHPRKRSAELIAKWGLAGFRKYSLDQLKGGTLKRFLVAQSLVTNPDIWLLDEPTLGMDRLGKRLLWEEMRTWARHRITLLVTQDMELAECADDLMLLESGACRRLGPRKFLTASVPEGTVASWYRTMQTFSRLKGSLRRSNTLT